MRRKVIELLFVILILVAFIVVGYFCFLKGRSDSINEGYEEYMESTLEMVEVQSDIFMDTTEITDESELVVNACEEKGIKGGVSKESLATLGEAELPEVIELDGYEEWYSVSTADGVIYCVVTDGEVIFLN